MHVRRERLEGGSVQACNEAMKDIFVRCCKKMAVKVCTIHDYAFYLYSSVCSINVPCKISDLIYILTAVYFRRLKINYDSHEFIRESGTVANMTSVLNQLL